VTMDVDAFIKEVQEKIASRS